MDKQILGMAFQAFITAMLMSIDSKLVSIPQQLLAGILLFVLAYIFGD